jgi:hypothetical protein
MIVKIPVSIGELIDKITILKIKQRYITDIDKLKNINLELSELLLIVDTLDLPDISDLTKQLQLVNDQLWHLENYKRECEHVNKFTEKFVEAARQVYYKNDIRAKLKQDINSITGSTIIEEKSYKK